MATIKSGRKGKYALAEKIGIFSSFLLFTVFSVYLYSPVIISHAEEGTSDLSAKVRVKQVLSLSFDKTNLTLEGNPNNFVTGTLTAEVSSNSKYGYTLIFSDRDDNTNLDNDEAPGVINPFTSNFENTKTSDLMEENTWGYSLDGTNFIAIPASSSAVTLRNTSSRMTTESENTTLTFGAKIGYVYSGTYSDKIIYTAFVNGQDDPFPVNPTKPTPGKCEGAKSFYHINTLQEMNSCTCSATTTPLPTATEHVWEETDDNTKIPRTFLIDIRDGKSYIVQKLANGQCWMAQNLELELSTTKTLTNQDTDLNAHVSWTPGSNTSNDMNTFMQHSCDKKRTPGCKGDYENYMYWSIYEDDAHSYRPPASRKYYRNGVTPSSTPSTNDGKSNWESTGYYYDQTAATAGTNIVIINSTPTMHIGNDTNAESPDSICPKGWRLPRYDYISNGYNGEYGYTEDGNDYEFDEYAYEHPEEYEDYVFDPMKIFGDPQNLQFPYRNNSVDYFNTFGFVAAGRIKAAYFTDHDYSDPLEEPILTDAEFVNGSEYGVYNTVEYYEYEYGGAIVMKVTSSGMETDESLSRYWDGRSIRCVAR